MTKQKIQKFDEILDASNKSIFHSSRIVSEPIIDEISQILNKAEVVFVGTNQKGISSCWVCNKCGFIPRCQRCDRNYYLNDHGKLKCPICGQTAKPEDNCPKCKNKIVKYVGIGINRLFSEMKKLFPKEEVLFIGEEKKSETRKKYVNGILALKRGIVVCSINFFKTAKFNENTALLVFLNPDKTLFLPDFNSYELKYQEIAEVISRDYKIMLQTKYPDNEIIKLAVKNNYQKMKKNELKLRKDGLLPPFYHLIKFMAKDKEETKAQAKIQKLLNNLAELNFEFPLLLEPYPAYPEKIRDQYRFNLVVGFKDQKIKNHPHFVDIIRNCSLEKINVDVDPVSLL
ncbi:MAG: hypothetical protein GF347_01895 [Candidatus Moranbacteria bacterium]|nr:hypothetical protein [Candidatus Moranbacteria bacterium]